MRELCEVVVIALTVSCVRAISTTAGVCDIFATGGTPCVAAHSLSRALYVSYDGPLFTVRRESDGATAHIKVKEKGGTADTAATDRFCGSTLCTVERIYDQSEHQNHLGPGEGFENLSPPRNCMRDAAVNL